MRFVHVFLAFLSRVAAFSVVLMALASAGLVDHKQQADVLAFLKTHQPEVYSAERQLSWDNFLATLEQQQIVFVGEKHDRYEHHLHQLAIIQAMHAQNPKLAIGMEWFQQPFQPVLDRYLAGDIDFATLLVQSEYYDRWRYDVRQLRPILQFARDHNIPLLALNAQVEITRKVSKQGLDGLNASERAQIPEVIHPAVGDYRDYLQEVFDTHMQGMGNFERFMLIQRIWDETMAKNVVHYLQQNPDSRMVVLAGSGHSASGTAIPSDVERQLPNAKQVSVYTTDDKAEVSAQFDYWILSEAITLPPRAKLGVWLDQRDEGLFALKVSENSAAALAGVKPGDQLLQINDQKLQGMADLLLYLGDFLPGDQVLLQVKRDGGVFELPLNLGQ